MLQLCPANDFHIWDTKAPVDRQLLLVDLDAPAFPLTFPQATAHNENIIIIIQYVVNVSKKLLFVTRPLPKTTHARTHKYIAVHKRNSRQQKTAAAYHQNYPKFFIVIIIALSLVAQLRTILLSTYLH